VTEQLYDGKYTGPVHAAEVLVGSAEIPFSFYSFTYLDARYISPSQK
jgi:hypothetical protein